MNTEIERVDRLSSRQRALLELLKRQQREKTSSGEIVRRSGGSSVYPLSYSQRRLWFIDQMEPESSVYNIPMAVRLAGPLDVDALRRSLEELIRRHEVLRTRIKVIDGEAVQEVAAPEKFEMRFVDLSDKGEAEREQTVRLLADRECQTPFDLTRGQLLRVSLLKLRDEEHVVVFVMHHIISDDWSMGIVIAEVASIYAAYSTGNSSALDELPIQYGDFAEWQRGWLTGEVLEKQLEYWRDKLAEAPAVLELPTDRPRAAVQSLRGAAASVSLPAELSESLKKLGQQQDATLFMTLLAAFQILLLRYSGQEDLVIGTPIANRTRVETEKLIGFFVNTLAMRTDLSGNPTISEAIKLVRDTTLGAYAHQDLPFERLVEELQPQRSLSHTPIFQVVFVLQNAPWDEAQGVAALELSGVEVRKGTAKFDLTLNMKETAAGLTAAIEYRTELFDEQTITRMLAHYHKLLEAMAADPDSRIWSLPILTSEEERELLCADKARIEFDSNHSLHEMFEEQAALRSGAPAVSFEAETITYAELNSRANRLATYLRGIGVTRETVVGLCLERSADMIAAILGVLKAGGAYLPLDPTYPADRLAYMLRDAGAAVLVSQESLKDLLTGHQCREVLIDGHKDEIDQCDDANPALINEAEDLAYVIYTSGSTGKPKGVGVSHANVVRLLKATDEWFQFGEADVWTMFHSYGFDFSVWEIWGALLYGGRLVVVPYWVSRTPEAFLDLVREEGVTVLNQTPSAFRQFIKADESGDADLKLRLVIFGGEALDPAGLRGWIERHGDEQPVLVNMYGITETTVHVTYRKITRDDVEQGAGSVIGEPIPDLQLYVLDGYMNPAPAGVTGEIYVGGAGLARGYLGRGELSAERFVPDPFSGKQGARLYRSGDLARRRGDDLEYLGRADNQVKIRGYRIELGEIEAELSSEQGVAQAIVLASPDSTGGKRLVAYLVKTEGADLSILDLRTRLKERLPEHMVPSAFIEIDEVPLTGNGKLDRRALPDPDSRKEEAGEAYAEPQTPVEEILAGVWSQVLRLDRVGIDDNFFSLGGDSIRSIQVRSLAQERGLDIALQQMFQHQTIRELSEHVQFASDGERQAQTEPFSLISDADRVRLPETMEDAYPLTMLQAGMLFHSEYDSSSNVYHNISSYSLKAPFDADAMRRAIDGLMGRHAVLRTSFDLSSYSEPLQLVHRSVETPLEVHDLRELSDEEQERAIAQWLESEKAYRFDFSQAPLIRVHVHRRDESDFQFTLVEHHAILDGWSVASLLTELFQSYLSEASGSDREPVAGPALTFRDYVALERSALESEESRRYWEEKLAGSGVTRLPRLSQQTQERSLNQVAIVEVQVGREVTDGLIRIARAAAAPLKSVLLAAHLKALSVLSGEPDVVTGLVMNGRPEVKDGERILGLFLNTVPYRAILRGGSWTDLVRQAFQGELEAVPHRRYPMAELQKRQGGEGLFETAFNFTHFHVYENLRGFDEIEVMGGDSVAETNFDWLANFNWNRSSSELRVTLHGNLGEFTEDEIRRMAGYYERALREMARGGENRYERCDLLADAEREMLLREWNSVDVVYDSASLLQTLFEERAAATPGAVAVKFDGKGVSYDELNSRANRLAHYLRAIGVGRETMVGLCLERSVEMIVAIVGVLKAGGTYVPMDPAYPKERLTYMLEDARAEVVLTQEALIGLVSGRECKEVLLDNQADEINRCDDINPHPINDSGDLAYVIYTSGSTGKPKGVGVSHANVVRLFKATEKWFRFDESDVWTMFHSYGFDFSVWEIWGALLYGGSVVVVPYWISRTPEAFVDLVEEEGVTVLSQTPSAFRQFIRADEQRSFAIS